MIMPYYLGIDTSNYTTSAAVYSPENGMILSKKLLPVKQGQCGLRQSDAVFHHVQQLPEVLGKIFADFDGKITAVGVSSRPRDVDGSYMPCFTVGLSAAEILSKSLNVPLYKFSHQSGHIAAAVYSSGHCELMDKAFLAFHISGGTTEALIVRPDEDNIFSAELAAKTLDLNAGQLVDRVGVMLGLGFPCGAELEKLALKNTVKFNVRPTLKGCDCCLSGIENICAKAYKNGEPKESVAALCLEYIKITIERMCAELLKKHGELPVIFAGGVMSDRIIKEYLEKKFGCFFAKPEYSTDNAAGTALLCAYKDNKNSLRRALET